MVREGRIADTRGAAFEPWGAERVLRVIFADEARLSRGFLRAEVADWFAKLSEFWHPLICELQLKIVCKSVFCTLSLPPEIRFYIPFEVNGEAAVFCLDPHSYHLMTQAISPGCQPQAALSIADYVLRRLLATAMKSWAGRDTITLQRVYQDNPAEIKIAGACCIQLEISGQRVDIWLGLGSKTVEKLDALWRTNVINRHLAAGGKVLSDQIHLLSVELTELAVPPVLLIDYMRTGTLIDLDIPFSSEAQIRLDGELWAEGELCQYDSRFAVKVTNLTPAPRVFPPATNRVRIEIGRTELDQEGLLEQQQNGTILLTETAVSSRASLIISGENVASALVGQLNGNFALSVLPK